MELGIAIITMAGITGLAMDIALMDLIITVTDIILTITMVMDITHTIITVTGIMGITEEEVMVAMEVTQVGIHITRAPYWLGLEPHFYLAR